MNSLESNKCERIISQSNLLNLSHYSFIGYLKLLGQEYIWNLIKHLKVLFRWENIWSATDMKS